MTKTYEHYMHRNLILHVHIKYQNRLLLKVKITQR